LGLKLPRAKFAIENRKLKSEMSREGREDCEGKNRQISFADIAVFARLL
jgi:hypothetical protein